MSAMSRMHCQQGMKVHLEINSLTALIMLEIKLNTATCFTRYTDRQYDKVLRK